MGMPLEIELLIAAWDNAKKNVFDGDGMNIDPETGEIIDGAEMPDELADLVVDINDKMMDLVSHYRNDEMPDNVFYGQDEESSFVGIRYDDEEHTKYDIGEILKDSI